MASVQVRKGCPKSRAKGRRLCGFDSDKGKGVHKSEKLCRRHTIREHIHMMSALRGG